MNKVVFVDPAFVMNMDKSSQVGFIATIHKKKRVVVIAVKFGLQKSTRV